MNDLKTRLERALLWRDIPQHQVHNNDFIYGVNHNANHLAPLHAALILAVEALELYASEWLDDGHAATEALARISEALK